MQDAPDFRELKVPKWPFFLGDAIMLGLAYYIYWQAGKLPLDRWELTALSVFNDTITREAAARGLALIDLRLICTEDEDLANPIEPSVIGGAKIANAIAAFAADYDSSRGRCEVFTGFGAKT